MRSAAQVVSYEIAMGFIFVGVLLPRAHEYIAHCSESNRWHLALVWLPLLPLFVVYWICGSG